MRATRAGRRAGWLRVAAVTLALSALPSWAAAATSCTVGASGVAFGTYDPRSGSPTDSTGSVTVTCSLADVASAPVQYDIALGTGSASSYAPRKLQGTGWTLDYNLYTDSARQVVWGDGSAGTAVVSDGYTLSATPVTRDYPVHGRIPAGQDVAPDAYADTITVTVNY